MLYVQTDSKWVTCLAHPNKGEVDVWSSTRDKVASCWSCNKLSLEAHCNTIPSSKQKMGWSWSCVLVCWVWSPGVYILHCYWAVGSSASTAGEIVHSQAFQPQWRGWESFCKHQLFWGHSLVRGKAGRHRICATGNRPPPFSCSDCS